MKQKFLLAIVFFLLTANVFAQIREARKIDEFGAITCDEYLARADTMITARANNPTEMVYVFIYEGKEKRAIYKNGELTGYKSIFPQYGSAKAKIESMKKYIKLRTRSIENYVFVNGGFREESRVEIWLAPAGAQPPKPTPTLEKMKYRKGKPRGFCTWCC